MTKLGIRAKNAITMAAVMVLAMGWFTVAAWAAPCDGPAETKKIVMMGDWLPWASMGPMFAAQLSGYYADEGIEVEVIAPANPADPIKLVARERVNFSLTYVPEVMLSRETGIPVVSVAATLRVIVSGLFFNGDQPINSPADLKGMTLGVGPKIDAQAYLRSLLEHGGLTLDDVMVVDPGFAHNALIADGKIDASHGLTYAEGIVADEINDQFGRPPARWLLYRDYGVPPFYYQLLVTNENWAKNNPNAVCRFLRATKKGALDYFKNPDPINAHMFKGNEIFTLAQHTAISSATMPDWQDANGNFFAQDVEIWKQAQDWAVDKGVITVPSDPAEYFTNEYLPQN